MKAGLIGYREVMRATPKVKSKSARKKGNAANEARGPLGKRIGGLCGVLRLGDIGDDPWRKAIRERNWRD
ncbi:MAG: hypothetical protein ABMA26_07775 [Limisphaerales bacterium]